MQRLTTHCEFHDDNFTKRFGSTGPQLRTLGELETVRLTEVVREAARQLRCLRWPYRKIGKSFPERCRPQPEAQSKPGTWANGLTENTLHNCVRHGVEDSHPSLARLPAMLLWCESGDACNRPDTYRNAVSVRQACSTATSQNSNSNLSSGSHHIPDAGELPAPLTGHISPASRKRDLLIPAILSGKRNAYLTATRKLAVMYEKIA